MRQFFLGSVLAGLVFCIGCAEEATTTIDSNLESADYEAQMIEGANSETTPAGDTSFEAAPVEAAPAEAPAEAAPAEAAPAEAPAEETPAEAPTE